MVLGTSSFGKTHYLIVAVLLKVVKMVEQCQAAEQDYVLLSLFNEQPISDGVVQYLRLLTSAHLQSHADFFCNFVEAPNLPVYCRQVSKVLLPSSEETSCRCWSRLADVFVPFVQEVEVMGMECDHVDILALSEALDICTHIVSMDGDEQLLAHHMIPEGAEPSLHLLYQTSHYNILYPRPHHWPATRHNPAQLRNSNFGWIHPSSAFRHLWKQIFIKSRSVQRINIWKYNYCTLCMLKLTFIYLAF